MKRHFSILLAAMIIVLSLPVGIFTLSASAETVSGTCGADGDNLTWELNTATGVLTISGNGEMINYDSSENYASWYSYTNYIETVIFNGNVTSIGDYAFSRCSDLSEITIPNSVTSIGYCAFYYCSSLSEINIPDSVTSIENYAFYGCSSLINVAIGNGLTSIGDYTFYNCSCLTNITIGNGVTNIADYAFSRCSGLSSIIIPNSVTSIGNYAFYGCSNLNEITISDSVTNIGNRAFEGTTYYNTESNWENGVLYNGKHLIEVETSIAGDYSINEGTVCIGYGAFYCCSSLSEIIIPNSVTSVGQNAFFGCSSLNAITIPNSVTSVGQNAFFGCSSLTEITIPGSVTSIGNQAFSGCSSLGSITTNEDNEAYYSDGNCLIEMATKTLILGCKSSVIPSDGSVEIIGSGAFSGCSSLTEITIPNSVTSVGQNAFFGCSSLTEITIPNSVTSIGIQAFFGCSSLTEIIIPDSVTYISRCAFSGCSSLTEITIPNSITSIDWCTFEDCSSLTSIIIPDSVTFIGRYAFSECSSLTNVYYAGSEEDKNNINIYNYNDYLLNATWHYNYVVENPLTMLGAKINVEKQALRLGATYDRDALNAMGINAADVIDMGIVFCPAKFVSGELTLDSAAAVAVSAAGVENYDPEKVFEDYETLTFYATIVNIPVNGLGTEISFRAYIRTADRVIYADDTLTRSYNYVHKAIYGTAPGAEDAVLREGDNGIICHTSWWDD